MIGQLVATVVGDETLGIYEPKAAPSFVLGETLTLKICHNLLSYANTSTPRTVEDCSLIFDRHPGLLYGTDDTSEYHRTCALYVIVKARILLLIPFESREWILEILKLDDDAFEMRSVN